MMRMSETSGVPQPALSSGESAASDGAGSSFSTAYCGRRLTTLRRVYDEGYISCVGRSVIGGSVRSKPHVFVQCLWMGN